MPTDSLDSNEVRPAPAPLDLSLDALADGVADRLADRLTAGPPPLLDLRAAAAWLGVSTRTVESLVALGEVPVVRIGMGRGVRRFERAALAAYVRRSTKGA